MNFSGCDFPKKWRTEVRGSLQSRRASFYHGAKIRNSAVLPLAGNLLGSAFPKPCYAACAAYPRRAHAARKEVTTMRKKYNTPHRSRVVKTRLSEDEYGFTSPEQLEAAVDTAYQEMRQTSGELKALETKLQGKKELQQQVLAYAKTKPARDGLRAQKSQKARDAYRQANESDFIIADAAARYFKAHGITKLPARKALQDEIEQLVSKKSGLYNTYHEQKQRYTELQTIKRNIDQILRREEPRRRKEQSHER